MSNDEPVKPRRVRAMSIRDLRELVPARQKMLISTMMPLEEGVKIIEEDFKVDHDSALAFVQWLRGEAGSPGFEPGKKQSPIERIHVTTDPRNGEDRYVETEPGSIPPRPVGAPPPGSKKPKGR